ncbi:MAG: GNAT family N-acetyltransferase [Bacteroidia bacterium]|nr:GNAT family N-acetyltransferase [Bacteroidia bacterium]
MIRFVNSEDTAAISDIYNYYIRHSISTFEECPVTLDEMQSRIDSLKDIFPYYVLVNDSNVLGYAYSSPWNKRSAYKNSVEVSIYLHHKHLGKGYGTALYSTLFKTLKEKGYHTLIGGISLPNEASVLLHEKFGFSKVAHFKEVGFKFGKWIDVGYWQKIIK